LFAFVKQNRAVAISKISSANKRQLQFNLSYDSNPAHSQYRPRGKGSAAEPQQGEGRSVNELLNEAMKHYPGWRGVEMRNSEDNTLSALRAYRKQAPDSVRRLMNLLRPKRS
jgi:hypothetical protein